MSSFLPTLCDYRQWVWIPSGPITMRQDLTWSDLKAIWHVVFQSVRVVSFCRKYFYIYYMRRNREVGHSWACAGFLIFMHGAQSHEARQENLAENWAVHRFSDFFVSHYARQSSSTSRCVSQIENYIKESMKAEMAQLQQSAVHNHTAAMLEMGTNLLSQTAEQTRKLTDVETQVRTLRCMECS